MSKNKEEKMKMIAQIKCHSCDELGHLASDCPNKHGKKAQAYNEKQGNEKQHIYEQGRKGSIKESLLLMLGKGTHG